MSYKVTTDNPGQLSLMLGVAQGTRPLWADEDLAPMLAHQLACRVEFERGSQGLESPDRAAPPADGNPALSFRDLLVAERPDLDLLRRTKDMAKAQHEELGSEPPAKISLVLYYLSILVARTRCGARISSLSDEQLGKGAQWVVAQPWVDEDTRRLCRQHLSLIRNAPGS